MVLVVVRVVVGVAVAITRLKHMHLLDNNLKYSTLLSWQQIKLIILLISYYNQPCSHSFSQCQSYIQLEDYYLHSKLLLELQIFLSTNLDAPKFLTWSHNNNNKTVTDKKCILYKLIN
jgi:hypothetical protein